MNREITWWFSVIRVIHLATAPALVVVKSRASRTQLLRRFQVAGGNRNHQHFTQQNQFWS